LMNRPDGADDSTRLEPRALMLHAGLLMSELDPLEPHGDSDGDFPPAEVRRAAAAIAKRTCKPPSRRELWEAIDRGDERAEDIEAYVRDRARRDRRACYNLACFEVGLAGRFPPMRERLLALALADAKQALRDRKLAAWARKDPALRLELLEGRPDWDALLGRQPAAPAERKTAVPAAVATASARPIRVGASGLRPPRVWHRQSRTISSGGSGRESRSSARSPRRGGGSPARQPAVGCP
jgi:hypothetical protein